MCPTAPTIEEEMLMVQSASHNKVKLGGPGIIVIIDLIEPHCGTPNNLYLMGMAELKNIPIETYFEYVENNNLTAQHFIKAIRTHVIADSWLLFDDKIFAQEYYDALHDLYPVVTNRSCIEVHNTPHEDVVANLTTIWKYALSLYLHLKM